MKLLKIDHKLLVLHLATATTYNITDNLTINNTIKQIIGDYDRFAILTPTHVYYLHHDNDFKLVDITEEIKWKILIGNIKFIVGADNRRIDRCDIGIITNSNECFLCKIKGNTFKSIKYIFKPEHNIVAVSSDLFGYVYKLDNNTKKNLQMVSTNINNDDNKYVVGEYDYYGEIYEYCIIDGLPTTFMSPQEFILNGYLVYYDWDIGLYKKRFNSLHVDNYFSDNYKIVLNDQTKVVEYHAICKTSTIIHHIGYSYYHVDNLEQYNNVSIRIDWTPGNHHLFDRYSNKFVINVLLCDKYGKLRKWIPKGILYVVIKFALCG